VPSLTAAVTSNTPGCVGVPEMVPVLAPMPRPAFPLVLHTSEEDGRIKLKYLI
jgi:hypothetical protein